MYPALSSLKRHHNVVGGIVFSLRTIAILAAISFDKPSCARGNEMVYFLPFSHSELVEQELVIWKKRVGHYSLLSCDYHHTVGRRTSLILLTWDKRVVDLLTDGYNMKYDTW